MNRKAKVGLLAAFVAAVGFLLFVPEHAPQESMTGSSVLGSRGDRDQGTLQMRSFSQHVRNNWFTRRVHRGWEWKVRLLRSWFGEMRGTAHAQTREGVPKIVDKPIAFPQERKDLTLAYRRQHQDPNAQDIIIAPKMVILHWTAINSFDAAWKYFNSMRAESARTALANAGDVNVSAHFLVDRDGTIYRLMPETWMARHCIGLNHLAIGIENVGDGSQFPLTEAQLEADAALVRYLKGKYPEIKHLIGHQEYRQMEGTPLFVERDPKYRNTKPDPGAEFMKKVRERVGDLRLEGPPGKD